MKNKRNERQKGGPEENCRKYEKNEERRKDCAKERLENEKMF